MPQFDPPIVVLAFSALQPGSIVRCQSDRYGFCAVMDSASGNRCLVLHEAESGKFEYADDPAEFVIAYEKDALVIRPSIDSFQSDSMPNPLSTGELYFRDGLPVVLVQTGEGSLALLDLESGVLEGFDPDDPGALCGFTAWSLGVWQSDGEFLALIEVDCEYGESE